MSSKIHIINYGMGNLHSIQKKLQRLKVDSVISSDISEIKGADKIILPGVGHFQMAMDNIKKLGLLDVLNEVVLIKRKPILGICLGMQLMSNKSEEGNADGLGWIDAEVVKLKVEDSFAYKVPHMGWNQISISKSSSLMKGISDGDEFYFVHSYHLVASDKADILNETEYEQKFTSAVEKNNIFGVQYHPEKSHDIGELLLKNFIDL